MKPDALSARLADRQATMPALRASAVTVSVLVAVMAAVLAARIIFSAPDRGRWASMQIDIPEGQAVSVSILTPASKPEAEAIDLESREPIRMEVRAIEGGWAFDVDPEGTASVLFSYMVPENIDPKVEIARVADSAEGVVSSSVSLDGTMLSVSAELFLGPHAELPCQLIAYSEDARTLLATASVPASEQKGAANLSFDVDVARIAPIDADLLLSVDDGGTVSTWVLGHAEGGSR